MNASNPVAWREERTKVRRDASCQTPWGQVELVALNDVSRNGCGVTVSRILLQPGDHVIIRSEGLLGASGTVRWAEGASIGVEFDAPLADRIMKCLQQPSLKATLIVPATGSAPLHP